MQELIFNVEQGNGLIRANFEEIKAQLEVKMNELAMATFTEESKTAAKAEVAELRKLKTAIDARRKEVKNIHMTPYLEFETQVKELISLVDAPITAINAQITVFEQKRIEEKKETIEKIYNENIGDMEGYLPLNKVYNPKWENASFKEKAIIEEIAQLVESTTVSVTTIKNMQSGAVETALAKFKNNLSLADAITYINDYETQKREILEKAQENEIEKAKEQGRAEAVKEQEVQSKIVEGLKQVDEAKAAALTTKDSISVLYAVKATPSELSEVETIFESFGICFERKDI